MVKTKRKAGSRRSGRGRSEGRSRGWALGLADSPGQVLGPDLVSSSLDDVIEALTRVPSDLPWSGAAGSVLPLIPRVRPYPPGAPDGLMVMVPPGIPVGFGIDFGPGFLSINAQLLERWAISSADLLAAALQNLHARAARIQRSEIHHGGPEPVVTEWLQTGRLVGSTLILAPTELERLFGPGARRFISPMRDLIIGFPPEADPELVCWYYAEIASQDPNCLGPISYLFSGGVVVAEPLATLFTRSPASAMLS